MPTHNSLDLLAPEMQDKAHKMISVMESDAVIKAAGIIKILPRETLRDLEVQMAYYSRTLWNKLGKKTDDKAALIFYVQELFKSAGLWVPTSEECLTPSTLTLKSKHLVGLAIDVAPSKDGLTPWWGAPRNVWQRIGEIGKSFGLKWGGDFKGLNDCPHFEM